MTAQQGGSELNKPTVYQKLDIFEYCKTKKDVVTYVEEILFKFVPEGTSLSITITRPVGYGGYYAIRATTGSSVT